MKELQDLLHELRCDINYCKVNFENDTEIDNANETLLKAQNLVKKLTIPVVTQAKRPVCPDCFDRGELRNDKEEITGTCPCHY